MSTEDMRVKSRLSNRLARLARAVLEPEHRVDPATVTIKKNNGSFEIPDCKNCRDRCCVHPRRDEGILLSLRDIATFVDSGLGDFIVGRYTFKKKNGTVQPEIDQMPRLKKRKGNCIFYDEDSGLCTEYGLRPTICRRFPYEVDYRNTKSGAVPIARFISEVSCPTISIRYKENSVQQMVADAIENENMSIEDEQLLPQHHKELRKMGFGPYLPAPKDCPT